jgi:acyl-CoA synthetase (AMP-forming)/AMP-acid ligase II
MNIVEPILFQCKFKASAKAVCTPGSAVESLTYGELERAIHNVARTALARGLAPRMKVGIAVDDPLLHSVLALGLLRLGVVLATGALQRLPNNLHLDAIISDAPRERSADERVLLADPGWTQGNGAPPDYDHLHRAGDDDLCRISVTSGTTGDPKAVGLTARVMRHRLCDDLYSKGPHFASSARLYSDFALANEIGFRQMLGQLWRGGTIYFLGTEPSAILDAFQRDDIQCMMAAPFGLGQFLQAFEAAPALTSRLQHIVCTGAGLSNELAERVRARICRDIYSWYGTAEVGTAAFGEVSTLARIPGAAGHVVPGAAIEVTDDAGQILPAGREGLIRIRTNEMADGYLGDPAATAELFRDGFFVPGDLGYLTADQLLVLTGRARTILNLGGHKVKPETIEEVLLQFNGVEQAAVFAMPDEFGIDVAWALIVMRGPLDDAALRTHCEARLMDISVPARFISVETIPRSPGSKIERHRLPAIAMEIVNGG